MNLRISGPLSELIDVLVDAALQITFTHSEQPQGDEWRKQQSMQGTRPAIKGTHRSRTKSGGAQKLRAGMATKSKRR